MDESNEEKGYKITGIEKVEGELCPFCLQKTLTLLEKEIEIPFFGKGFVFSMKCSNPDCNYNKSDVEITERSEPVKLELKPSDPKDMEIRVIKSSEATVVIPGIIAITPGPASNGYITNVEGIFHKVKVFLMNEKDHSDDEDAKKKLQVYIKKISKAIWNGKGLTLIIKDPSGNSAIISEKTKKSKLK